MGMFELNQSIRALRGEIAELKELLSAQRSLDIQAIAEAIVAKVSALEFQPPSVQPPPETEAETETAEARPPEEEKTETTEAEVGSS